MVYLKEVFRLFNKYFQPQSFHRFPTSTKSRSFVYLGELCGESNPHQTLYYFKTINLFKENYIRLDI